MDTSKSPKNKKTLKSGIEVDKEEYKRLVKWRKEHMKQYGLWCQHRGFGKRRPLITYFFKDLYSELLDISDV